MIEAFVDDNFTNLTPLGRIISNKEIRHTTNNRNYLPEFETLIDEDKSAFEVSLLYYLHISAYISSFVLLLF